MTVSSYFSHQKNTCRSPVLNRLLRNAGASQQNRIKTSTAMKTKITTLLSSLLVFILFASADEKKMQELVVTDITAEKAAKLIEKDPKAVVIDIRTPKEFAEGHIAEAKNIDFRSDTFKEELAKLDRDQTYLMHCLSGGRSTQSLEVWKELGFTKVYHLNSGFKGWKKAGLSLSRGE